LAHSGFAIAGIDSKVYLREFSSLKSPLTIEKLASDYADIAKSLRPYATVDPETPVFCLWLVSWSRICDRRRLRPNNAWKLGRDHFNRITKTEPAYQRCQWQTMRI